MSYHFSHKPKKSMLEAGKMSISAVYSGGCPEDDDSYRWGNKKRGGLHHKKKGLRDHRTGQDFRNQSNCPKFNYIGKTLSFMIKDNS